MSNVRVGVIPYHRTGICRGCGGKVPRSRLTWCSYECVTAALIRKGDPTVVRRAVLERDRGVCADCGLDTEQVARVLAFLQAGHQRNESLADLARGQAARVWLFRSVLGARRIGHLWEADHIIPVIEGGGGCGLEGYRTLCLVCHRLVTAELARRRARRRREAGMGLLPAMEAES